MSIPAGWYDDGAGRQRWWDGNGWTEHVAEAPAAQPVTPPADAQAASPAATPSVATEAAVQPAAAASAAPVQVQQPVAPVYATAQPARTNGLAIAALILGILGLGLIPVILGHVALGQIKRDPTQGGRGLAIAGLILGYLAIAAGIIVGIVLFVTFGLTIASAGSFS